MRDEGRSTLDHVRETARDVTALASAAAVVGAVFRWQLPLLAGASAAVISGSVALATTIASRRTPSHESGSLGKRLLTLTLIVTVAAISFALGHGGRRPAADPAILSAAESRQVLDTQIHAGLRLIRAPGSSFTTMRYLKLRRVPSGLHVLVRCEGSADDCPFEARQLVVQHALPTLDLTQALQMGLGRLHAGTQIEIVLTKPRLIGWARLISIRDGIPTTNSHCVTSTGAIRGC